MRSSLFAPFRSARPTPPAWPQAQTWLAPCGTELTLRPVRPADAPMLGELLDEGLSRASRYSRFHGAVGRLSSARLAWLADADFDRHAAFIVTRPHVDGETAVAEGRWFRQGDLAGAEFALSVADPWQRQGIGRELLGALVQAGRARGLSQLVGDVLQGNQAMHALARSQRFSCADHPEQSGVLRAELPLTRATGPRLFSLSAWVH
jgi:acetyltransferase